MYTYKDVQGTTGTMQLVQTFYLLYYNEMSRGNRLQNGYK